MNIENSIVSSSLVKSTSVSELKYDFSCELYRISTFSTFPAGVPISERSLARAGFYYTGVNDKVKCFCCGLMLDNWKPGDNAIEKHKQLYPSCSFVQNLMQTLAARLKTFCHWPASVPVHPEQLASAGFYYVGHSDDVKCFCCDGGLRCWESGDDPWVQHAKWFPRSDSIIIHLLSTSDTPEDENAESPIIHFGPGENPPEDTVMMSTPVVTAALEMGFGRRLVKQTVQSKILRTGENYKTVSDLVLDILNAEDEIRQEEKEKAAEEKKSDDLSLIRKNRMALFQHLTCVLPILDSLLIARVINEQEHDVIRQKTQIPLQARELIDTILVKGNNAATIFRNSLQENDPMLYKNLFVQQDIKYTPPEDVSELSVEEQLRRLQEERTCKVCMDKEVSVVFIPCGHLVVCKECAPSLRKCPICRGTIKGTVRTFLS
ncbi:baculoviral IAP repeat-containing protein 3 [Echinops telfairi]|uniref:Baculoviral IAP repeat-containing protein 3 n=1 Tax=Echinops telfairi TaxID=9371 RepID=A0AC55DPJ7_ECHTE|nr:baculoviral IAP repeat-containing protein 3 [Echinops telfairi]